MLPLELERLTAQTAVVGDVEALIRQIESGAAQAGWAELAWQAQIALDAWYTIRQDDGLDSR